MKLSNLEKATKVISQIKELDAEIISIDAWAMRFAEDEIDIEMCLSVDAKKSKGGGLKMSFDPADHFAGLYSYIIRSPLAETPEKEEYKTKISNTISLQVLGVLLYEKKTKREALIKKLVGMGLTL